MTLIALLQRAAEIVWPRDVAAAVLLGAAIAALLIGWTRRGRAVWPVVPLLGLTIACEVWALVAAVWKVPLLAAWPLGLVAFAFLLLYAAVAPDRDHAGRAAGGDGGGRAWLVAGLALTSALLLVALVRSPGFLHTWEPGVLEGFGEALRAGTSTAGFAGHVLQWDDGLVSRGDHSLLYGLPTYALFRTLGASVGTLRIVAALLALGCVGAMWLAARRLSRFVAVAAPVVLGLSLPLVFYGRYGTSLSGTLLGVVLAMAACWAFLARPRHGWIFGPLAGLALFAATLGYSPGRLVVLALVAVLAAHGVARLRAEGLPRLAGLLLFAAVLAGGWWFQERCHAAGRFLSARGEQVLTFMQQPEYLKDYLGRSVRPEELGLAGKAELAARVVSRTLPELVAQLTAGLDRRLGVGEVVGSDPPMLALFFPPLLPFVAIGMLRSLRRWRQGEHATLLAWAVLTCGPLLLTTRVDAHRTMILVVPLALWAALGLEEAAAALRDAGFPALQQNALACAVVALAAWSDVVAIFPADVTPSPVGRTLVAELASIRGPVVLASTTDHRDSGLVDLAMLERQRRSPRDTGWILAERILRPLADQPSPDPYWIRQLLEVVDRGTLLLAPADHFHDVAYTLQQSGMTVVEKGGEGARFWRASSVVEATRTTTATDVPRIIPRATPAPTPTPFVVALRVGPQISLSTLRPSKVEFGFAEPRLDQSLAGGPIVLGGVEYAHGLGMHAWCRMTFPVPAGATAFQAVVGASKNVHDCDVALLRFQVLGESGEDLWTSGLVDNTTPPQPVYVGVAGRREITLVVSDGDNGRDCDHGDWGEPAFLVTAEEPATAGR